MLVYSVVFKTGDFVVPNKQQNLFYLDGKDNNFAIIMTKKTFFEVAK